MMNRLRYLIAVGCIAMFPQVTTALFLDPCFSTGRAQILPTYPGPNDPIGFTLFVPLSVNFPLYPQYKYYWVRQSQSSSDTFVVDLILTDATTPFPGYTLVNPDDQNWGFIGPLPPGKYTILGTVNVYDPASGTNHPECDPATFGPAPRVTELDIFALNDPYYQSLRAVEAPVVEFYSPSLNHYFMTMNTSEILALLTNSPPGWEPTGRRFFAYVPGNFFNSRPSTNVRRYYGLPSAGLNSHFFTLDGAEVVALSNSNAWVLENLNAFEYGNRYLPQACVHLTHFLCIGFGMGDWTLTIGTRSTPASGWT